MLCVVVASRAIVAPCERERYATAMDKQDAEILREIQRDNALYFVPEFDFAGSTQGL